MVLLLLILGALAGFFNAIMDTLVHRYDNSVFKAQNKFFWDPAFSWVNKYKVNSKKPKFFLSTTLLVWLTDAWHLFKTLYKNCYRISLIVIILLTQKEGVEIALITATVAIIMEGISFNFFYWAFKTY